MTNGADSIKVTVLGGGHQVGRSCLLLSYKNHNVLLDCGVDTKQLGDRAIPMFEKFPYPFRKDYLQAVILTHFHLDHCGSLPYLTETLGYDGPIYMTQPTFELIKILLSDFALQYSYRTSGKDQHLFALYDVEKCLKKAVIFNVNENIVINDHIQFHSFYAAHVLGAVMLQISIGPANVFYTGDFSVELERVLGSCKVDARLRPHVLITESTFANTIRLEPRRNVERSFLFDFRNCMAKKGKAMFVFPFDRVMETCEIIEQECLKRNCKVPILLFGELAKNAYDAYVQHRNWGRSKEDSNPVLGNNPMVDIFQIKKHEKLLYSNESVIIIFPVGLISSSFVQNMIRNWSMSSDNLIVTHGIFDLSGKTATPDYDDNCMMDNVEQDSSSNMKWKQCLFTISPHVDGLGIIRLIQKVEPDRVIMVHGAKPKMQRLKDVLQNFNLCCSIPANGEEVICATKLVSTMAELSLNTYQRPNLSLNILSAQGPNHSVSTGIQGALEQYIRGCGLFAAKDISVGSHDNLKIGVEDQDTPQQFIEFYGAPQNFVDLMRWFSNQPGQRGQYIRINDASCQIGSCKFTIKSHDVGRNSIRIEIEMKEDHQSIVKRFLEMIDLHNYEGFGMQ